jgi:hypothetical protein
MKLILRIVADDYEHLREALIDFAVRTHHQSNCMEVAKDIPATLDWCYTDGNDVGSYARGTEAQEIVIHPDR